MLRPVELMLGGAKCCKVAGAGAGPGCFGEVGVDAREVDRGAGELMLEAGLGQAAVAGSAQAATPNALGDGSFHAGTDLVAGFPLIGLLKGAGLLEGLVLVVLPQGEFPAFGLG